MSISDILKDVVLLLASPFVGEKYNKITRTLERWKAQKTTRKRIESRLNKYYDEEYSILGKTEEFDFYSLKKYLVNHMAKEALLCLAWGEKSEKEQVKNEFRKMAYRHARADTDIKQRAVHRCIEVYFNEMEEILIGSEKEEFSIPFGYTYKQIIKRFQNIENKIDGLNDILINLKAKYSFIGFIDSVGEPVRSNSLFHYRNGELKFYGRSGEQYELNRFLDTNKQFQWIGVVGNAGAGKSRLLYEYIKSIEHKTDWKTVWLTSNKIDVLLSWYNFTVDWSYPRNLFLVIDYAGGVAGRLGPLLARWQEYSELKNDNKMRVVLIEREGNYKTTEMEEQWQDPFWYATLKGNQDQKDRILASQFRVRETRPFLEVQGLDGGDLKNIIEDYATKRGRNLSAQEKSLIINHAKKIEKSNSNSRPRPLILLFITDAVLENKNCAAWNVPELVTHIIKKYRNHWKEVLCENNENLYISLTEMLMYATVNNGWSPDTDVGKPLERSEKRLQDLDKDRLEQLICAVNEEEEYSKFLAPFEPDLIGECYVLEYVRRRIYNIPKIKKLGQLFWGKPDTFGHFLERCIQNYGSENYFKTTWKRIWETMEPEDPDNRIIYVQLLNIFSRVSFDYELIRRNSAYLLSYMEQTGKQKSLVLNYVEQLYWCIDKTCYARENNPRLFTGDKEKAAYQELEALVIEIRDFSPSDKDNDKYKTFYAKALMRLLDWISLNKQGAPENEADEYSESDARKKALQTQYVKELRTFIEGARAPGRYQEAEDFLDEYIKSNPSNLDIQYMYSQMLCNQYKLTPNSMITNIYSDKIMNQFEKYPTDKKMQIEYAEFLFLKSAKELLYYEQNALKDLQKLAYENSDNEDLQVVYMRVLNYHFNNNSNRKMAEEEMIRLIKRYPNNERLKKIYIKRQEK